MSKAELKTQPTGASVKKFLETVKDPDRKRDCLKVLDLMRKVTRSQPRMWGKAIVGFGDYHYKSPSGREGDWFQIGFSPRKQNLTLYLIGGFRGQEVLLKSLGKHKIGGSCLYISKLSDIDLKILKKLIQLSMLTLKRREQINQKEAKKK